MQKISYSLIVPTYNRLGEIQELIESLDKVDSGNYKLELIIVDDGSTDDTRHYLESPQKLNFSLQYFYQQNQGPGAARNVGMLKATGNYFLFIDSDCTLPPQYFNKLTEHILGHNPDAFGGPDTYHESFPPLLKAINYSMTSFIGTGGTRGSSKSVTKYFPRSFNMGIHRKVFEKIGGFGKLRHGQDMDYSARIYDANFKVDFVKEAFVYHKRRTNLFKFYRQIHNWGVARINLGRMHRQMLKPIHFAPAIVVLGAFFGISAGIIFSPLRWVFYTIVLTFLLVGIFAFFQSLLQYKNLKVAAISVITLFIQVFAYGIGFINGWIQVNLLGKKTAIGITKNYY